MSISRRSFFKAVGAGGAGVLAAPLITWRGHETLLAQGAAARRADRLMAARPGVIRIDSNENPNGPGERVYGVIRRHLGESNRYPVRSEDDLAAAIARTHGIQPDNVILGSGSGELLRAAVSAFGSPARAVVSPDPTFEACASWAKFIGVPIVAPRVDGSLRLDLDAMADTGRGAGLVYLCNPNNPTATVHSAADVTAYVEQVGKSSPDTTVLIDEAYHEYVDEPSYATAIPLALANPRVVVTRTFSKVFGMAGLRAGYAVGQPATLARMAAWLLGSNISQLTLVAAAVAVADGPHIALEQRRNRATRAYTRTFFERAGYQVARSDANFLMVDIRRDAKQFKLDALKHNVAVGRQFASLPNWVRVSVGTMPEMRKALGVFDALLT
ncbi:MAG TPA: aminotransferase class I/II-fold pyridoxal phosphate-dependent enzyme [Gemmatimonadales bacterium]|nr:aminotransferase class I/II-fold pyridoxal phosphate-dependent enzyme [Gemmatimonadales bacterium]